MKELAIDFDIWQKTVSIPGTTSSLFWKPINILWNTWIFWRYLDTFERARVDGQMICGNIEDDDVWHVELGVKKAHLKKLKRRLREAGAGSRAWSSKPRSCISKRTLPLSMCHLSLVLDLNHAFSFFSDTLQLQSSKYTYVVCREKLGPSKLRIDFFALRSPSKWSWVQIVMLFCGRGFRK